MKKIILNRVNTKSKNYKKFFALVDNEDFSKVNQYNWTVQELNHTNYCMARIGNRGIFLHVFIMGVKGIDHINNNGLDCQKKNLRIASQQQNRMNSKPHRKSTSKFKGVFKDPVRGKWIARIGFNYKSVFIGRFNTEIEAMQNYNNKAKELYGDFAKLNI